MKKATETELRRVGDSTPERGLWPASGPRAWRCGAAACAIWIGLATWAGAAGAFLELRDGYFWDPSISNYWIPRGFAYQTINPPIGATQTLAQLEYDLREMRNLRANSLRVDFTWGQIETNDNAFDWTVTDFLVERAEALGLKLFPLIGYQYPPAWFPQAWRAVNQSNEISNLLNYEHPMARAAFTDFIARVTARYQNSPAVAAWILGNEFAYFDLWETYDPHRFVGYDTNYSLPSFRAYLTNVYEGDIGALNACWGTGYSSFDEIPMPREYPGAYNPGNVHLQNRYAPAYHDLIQWRKRSLGDFVALAARAAQQADPNHLRSYSTIGGIYSGFDANNPCEDAGVIAERCAAAGAPLDFLSLNNYAWALEGNELRSAQFGLRKYQDSSGLPVLVTETGHSSTETLFPGAAPRQAAALASQLWEALMAGALGVHVFTWNDRPQLPQVRERGFGIVQGNRLVKRQVYDNVREVFRRMEQISVEHLFGGSRALPPDVFLYWSADADMVYPRANQENTMLWGGLKRAGYLAYVLPDYAFEPQLFTNAPALLVPHAFIMRAERLHALTNLVAAGFHLHAHGTLPGRYDPYHRENAAWSDVLSNLFGLAAAAATNTWHGGISGAWDQPYTSLNLEYLAPLGPLGPGYLWTNVATWLRMSNLTAASGTTFVRARVDNHSYPALHIKTHPSGAKAVMTTWPLGDTVDMSWLNPKSQTMVWQLHYDWCRAIYREALGLSPRVDLVSTGYVYVIWDVRLCTNGTVLLFLLNESSNAAAFEAHASNLLAGLTIEQLVPPAGILETNSDGVFSVTLPGDGCALFYAHPEGASLANPSAYKVWIADDPPAFWPNGQPREVVVGCDTRGASLDLHLALERADGGVTTFAHTQLVGVAGRATNVLGLLAPDADLPHPRYVSSAEGATYRLRARLQSGSVTQSQCTLSTRLLWGAKPVSLPPAVETGQTYQVGVLWQDLPSYLDEEYPTPLDRAAVWEPSAVSSEVYTVFLDLMTGGVAVVSSGIVTAAGSGTNLFSLSVPAGTPGPFAWRARAVSGNQLGPTSNRHDVLDGFEGRARGEGSGLIAPWVAFTYAEWTPPALLSQGVNELASEGTNAAFLVVTNLNPGSYSGFGMWRDYAAAWSLPSSNEWTNIWFAFDFRETNLHSGTLEVKLEDADGNPFHYMKAYAGGGAWDTIRAHLGQFSRPSWNPNFDPTRVKRLVVVFQMSGTGLHLGLFDRILFTGTPWVVESPPSTSNADLHTSFEGLARGEYVNPVPWTLASYGDGSEKYLTHGIDGNATHGTNGHFAVYQSHTNVGGWSGFYLTYAFGTPPRLPTNLAQAGFSVDFYENDNDPCDIELQLKSPGGGLSTYARAYAGPGWDTIRANLSQFSGTAVLSNLNAIVIVCIMKATNRTYTAHFDNILFTGTVSAAAAPVTNGLYLSLNDSSTELDSDGDGIPDLYETGTGIYRAPNDTGTDPQNADTDGDGWSDGDEVIVGSNPNEFTPPEAYWRISGAGPTASAFRVEWFARTGRVYTVHYCDGSLLTNAFQPLPPFTNIVVVSEGPTQIVDTAVGDRPCRFYRLSVRFP